MYVKAERVAPSAVNLAVLLLAGAPLFVVAPPFLVAAVAVAGAAAVAVAVVHAAEVSAVLDAVRVESAVLDDCAGQCWQTDSPYQHPLFLSSGSLHSSCPLLLVF